MVHPRLFRSGPIGPWAAVALAVAVLATPLAAQQPATESNARARQYDELARDVASLEKHYAVLKKVVRLVRPAVVHIEASKRRGGGEVEETGSGVIIRFKDGFFVVTNRHVIRGAAAVDIKIKLADGRQITPSRVWGDPGTDIAVMAVSAPKLVPARLGSSAKMEMGDFVLAMGSPFGLSHSVTYGIISAKGRRNLQLGNTGVRFQNFIQTDAAINPGNSGGPLINLRGEVVGINTAIASQSGSYEGVGFSIPIDMVRVVTQQLIEQGKVVRAFLGVSLDANFGPARAIKLGLPRPQGARITGITDGAPAQKAKLRIGDVIVQFDGTRVEDDSHLVNLVALTSVGKEVKMEVFRDGKTITLRVRVSDRSKFNAD